MHKTVMYCDKCGKEYEKWNHKRDELICIGEIISNGYDPYFHDKKDLCESCYTELENWWNSQEETNHNLTNDDQETMTKQHKTENKHNEMKLSNQLIFVLSIYSYAFAIAVGIAQLSNTLRTDYLGIGMIVLAVLQVIIAFVSLYSGYERKNK